MRIIIDYIVAAFVTIYLIARYGIAGAEKVALRRYQKQIRHKYGGKK